MGELGEKVPHRIAFSHLTDRDDLFSVTGGTKSFQAQASLGAVAIVEDPSSEV